MATKLPDLPKVTLRGPFWAAEAEMIQLADPVENWAFRTLFLESAPRQFGKENRVFLPGMLLVLCWVRSVSLHPADGDAPAYTWRRAGTAKPPTKPTPEQVRSLLAAGELALLLVQPDPPVWTTRDKDAPAAEKARFAELRVLGGDIVLDRLQPQSGARERVYAAAGLAPADPQPDRVGAARLPGQMSVHASGLSLFGTAALPWEAARVGAPFQLARVLPDGDRSAYRLTVEEERLTPAERAALVAAWRRLSTYLNPAHPLSGAAESAPAWVTLEVAAPDAIPRLHWELPEWDEAPQGLPLRFGRGEITLLLADQQPYEESPAPTSLARVVPEGITVARAGSGLRAEVTAGTIPAGGGTLTYRASLGEESWDEVFTLADAPLAFSPVETPRLVRDSQRLPVPEWHPSGEPVSPPVVWAFAPLAEGWTQLPVPNLTEQVYLDAGLASIPAPAEAVLQGAVAYGNDKPGAPEPQGPEQPWSLTLTNAAGVSGAWALEADGGGFRLAEVELALRCPEVTLNGLFWISTERPTLADALPQLDDWVAGLRPVSLGTVRPGGEMFPPVATTPVESLTFALRRTGSFPSAALGAWSLAYAAEAGTFGALVDRGVLPADAFGRHLPLVWRRHPALPMVQALPLTQALTPPNHPSRSRQLAPFELGVTEGDLPLPDAWRFGVPEGNGAASWPRLLEEGAAATEWRAAPDLPLAALSLPGLVLDPAAAATGTGLGTGGLPLPLQYRYDLPYTDEPNALAQLPRVAGPPAETPQLDGADARPQPLTRETLAEHWRRLSERASLAGVDAAVALRAAGGIVEVRNLVEPLAWPVRAEAALDAYPGSLTLDNASGDSAPLELRGDAALRGVSGRFAEGLGALRRLPVESTEDAYQLEGGSMAAARAADGTFRDQRGLYRGASAMAAELLRTPVRLHEGEPHELTSVLQPLELHTAADAGPTWRFWFRDVPVREGIFRREDGVSSDGLDVNDPHATDREHNFLNGYEWRLELDADGRVPLFGLHFYPLTLERLEVAGDEVSRVEMVGRLQLPLAGGGELPDFANAVRVAFARADGALVLAAVEMADTGVAEWPLALSSGEAGDAPRLEWSGTALDSASDALRVSGGRLRFFLFGADWSVPLEELVFTRAGTPVEQEYVVEGGSADEPLLPRTLALRIDPAGLAHAVSLLLGVRLGSGTAPANVATARAKAPTRPARRWRAAGPGARTAGANEAASAAPGRATFEAGVRFHVLGEAAGAAEWASGTLFGDLDIPELWGSAPNRTQRFEDGALHFTWQRAGAPGTAPALHLLPGMHVGSSDAPGFAALSFGVIEGGEIPVLQLRTAFVEALLHCRWGAFLQEPPLAGIDPLRRIFGSSAGDVAFGYTAQLSDGAWEEELLLNGFLEVKDLVSWPLAMSAAGGKLTLPAARGTHPLAHVRHTLRVLLNQHRVPAEALTAGAGDLLFDLRDDRAWQFLAVVEHQLVDVTPSRALDYATVENDRRWTAVQEVRFLTPASFRRTLASHGSQVERALDPQDGVDSLGGAHGGWLGTGMRSRLSQGSAPELDRLGAEALVVEAGALHWIRQTPVAASSTTTLQYLPNGSQLAIPSTPADYAPSDPQDPQWLLVTTPFLGRLQDQARDGVESSPPDASPLVVDPVLVLARARAAAPAGTLPEMALALAAWGDDAPVQIAVSALDSALGRLWTRLDPLSLEENWFRLQNPPEERRPAGLQSVLAALPATPARLGRSTALARAFEPVRLHHPPAASGAEPPSADLTRERPIWRPDALLGLQGASDRGSATPPPYGWYLTGYLLLTSALWRRDAAAERRTYPAATVLPAKPVTAGAPLPLAVSPYLGLDLRPALGEFRTRLVVAELLCLGGGTGDLLPVASHTWELAEDLTRADVADLARAWARENHLRLAPESPVAVLRFREVNERVSAPVADEAVLATTYTFEAALDLVRPERLARRVFRIRAGVRSLRFRDGRFGGAEMPEGVKPFELAPPQTVGVQPLRLEERPVAATPGGWPWGMSALSVGVRYTAEAAPAIGSADGASAVTLWWQAPQQRLQFRSPARDEGPTAGLPPLFRAAAVRGLLPVVPDAPLPALDATVLAGAGGPLGRWQPVLPGSLRYLLLGSRAGAMLALRHQLLRQSGLGIGAGRTRGSGLVSGSVPVQHRVPRPVPLPPNQASAPNAALRTWASAFDAETDVLATLAPADEGYFAAGDGQEARRIRLVLLSPAVGAVAAGWDGSLLFDVAFGDDADGVSGWNLGLELADGSAVYAYGPPEEVGDGALRFAPQDPELPARVAARAPGDTLVVHARVAPAGAAAGFFQTLAFTLRVAEGRAVPLPLEPRFFHFEDPEYNRRLASAAAHASGLVKTQETPPGQDPRTVLRTATLAADRKQYNPDGILSARYDWEDDWEAGIARLSLRRIDAGGVVQVLEPVAEGVAPGQLVQVSLAALRYRGAPVRLGAGDVLQLELRVEAQDRVKEAASVFLSLDVVAEPVQPVPEAAYALLKRYGDEVECARFAWSPEPARVELVNPADLRTQVVRRRGVFHWTDTIRRGATVAYAVQKVAPSGATHIPDLAR